MAAERETFLFPSGIDLADGKPPSKYLMDGFKMTPPEKKAVWVQGGPDSDGDELLDESHFNNRIISLNLHLVNCATRTESEDALRAVIQQLREAEKLAADGGLPIQWTPQGGARTMTIYALSGNIDELEIAIATGWFTKNPVVPVTIIARPFLYGQKVTTVTDNFSTDTLAAGDWSLDIASNVAVTSGVLQFTTTGVRHGLYTRQTYYDDWTTIKLTTGATVTSWSLRAIGKATDASNYICAQITQGGTLGIVKVVGGAGSFVGPTATVTAPSANTSYWLRHRIEGNVMTAEWWTSPPTPTGTPAGTTTATLAGADATTYGVGVPGKSGWRMVAGDAVGGWSLDDIQIAPYVYLEATTDPFLITPPIYGIKGDVPAEGELLLTERSNVSRSHIEGGLESRYLNVGLPAILDQFSTDSITGGAWVVDAGVGTIAVSGGQLVPSDVTTKRLRRTDSAEYVDFVETLKFTTTTSVTAFGLELFGRGDPAGAQTYIAALVDLNSLDIVKRVNGTLTTLATVPVALGTSTNYWVRLTMKGKAVTAELFTVDPMTAGASPGTTFCNYTMTDAELAQFAKGSVGFQTNVDGTGERYDDYKLRPMTGWTPLFIDSEQLDTSGFIGTNQTRTGAYTGGTVANHTVRATLTTSPQAVVSLGELGHAGTFRVKARVMAANWFGDQTHVRLSYRDGDGPLQSNSFATMTLSQSIQWAEVDLGLVTINKATSGRQRWTGQLEAYQDAAGFIFEVDYVELIPVENYSRASATTDGSGSLANVTQRDEFDQTAGNLAGKSLPVGGTWSAAGDGTADFVVNATTHKIEKSTLNTGSVGKHAIAGALVMTDTIVQVDVTIPHVTYNDIPPKGGVIARWTDANNYLRVHLDEDNQIPGTVSPPTSPSDKYTGYSVRAEMYIAGVSTDLGTLGYVNVGHGSTLSVRLMVDSAGVLRVWAGTPGALVEQIAWYRSELATGGALASGRVGIWDNGPNVTVGTVRQYDNFIAGPAPLDAAIFAGQDALISYNAAKREDASGNYWGDIQQYRGGRVWLPEYGVGRPVRLVSKARRQDVSELIDTSLTDVHQLQLSYTPRYLVVPGA